MDSELTLVNFVPPTPYFLSSTDFRNAFIFSRPGVPLYRITGDVKHIKICGGSTLDRIIAVLHHRDLRPDTIFFPRRHESSETGARTQMSLHRWFKRCKTSDGTPEFIVDSEYGPYLWKIVSGYRHKVFATYDLEKPIASCYLHPSLPAGKPAFVLESAGEPFLDDIVVTYVVQRYRVQMENKALDLFVGPS